MGASDDLTGVVLAGGRARRMGGVDKGLVTLDGRAMVSHVVDGLRAQVTRVVVSANRNPERYREATGCEVVADGFGDFAGPLAGMLSALHGVAGGAIVTCPCDSPFVAPDLVSRLRAGREEAGAELAVAHDGERLQPVFALVPATLATSLREYLEAGERKIDRWYSQHRMARVDFSDRGEMFLNVNTPEQRDEVETLLRDHRAGISRC